MILANAFTRIGKTVRALRALARRLGADRGGNVVMIFALVMPALIMITLGGIDLNRITTAKARVQDALDAATLAAARSSYTAPEDLRRVAVVALRANLKGASVEPFADSDVKINLTENQVVVTDLRVQVKTLVANIVLPPYGKLLDDTLPVTVHSEVNRSSKDIEVALVLDITGSMSSSKISGLKSAANTLVDIVVQDQQSPYYSKMSIVPYSMGVNLGSYATSARGTAVGPTTISNITWSTGAIQTVTAATRASTITITTSANHNFSVNDKVAFWDVGGMTQLNGVVYTVGSVPSSKTFTLKNAAGASNINSSNWNTLNTSNGPRVAECARTDCNPTVTSTNHGLLATGGTVYLDDVGGMSQLNQTGFSIVRVDANTYRLNTVGARTYTSGGSSYCGQYGCQWRVFTSAAGSLRWLPNSDCVSERTGSEDASDAYTTSSARVGFNYPASSNPCPASKILPLSSNKDSLKTLIGGLSAGGSTAGHIGAAWGWYTVSPNFSPMWSSSAAAPYDNTKVLKAVILMTDGEFNTPYASGVIASDAGSGSGSDADHINMTATNGDSFSQATKLCDAMKAKGVLVYTVGFQVPDSGAAAQLMKNCATTPAYAYLPTSSTDLNAAFQAIGRDITRLRISR